MTYLKLSGKKVGLLINFSGEFLKGNIERLVNGLPEGESLSANFVLSARNSEIL